MIPAANGAITLCFGLLFIAVRMPILRLFSSDPEILGLAGEFVVIMLLSQWMYAVFNGISCIINGTGRVKYTTVINLLMLWAVRVPAAYLLATYAGGKAIPFSFPISFAFGMLAMIGYYLFCDSWKKLMNSAGQTSLHVCSV
jgi:Na+-driven multidrug efflux pump